MPNWPRARAALPWLTWTLGFSLAALPCLAHLPPPHPLWAGAVLGPCLMAHGFALASLLLLLVWTLLRAGKLALGLIGFALLVFVASDALLYGLFGMHIGPGNFGHLLQPQAMTTLGLGAGDIVEELAICAALALAGARAASKRPRWKNALAIALVAAGIDSGALVFSAAMRFEGVQPLLGLTEALPLGGDLRLEKIFAKLSGHPPLSIDDDVQFADPGWRKPELRPLAARPLPDHAARKPDILIVLIESLRADAVEAMPRLRELEQNAIVARRHFSSGNCSFLGAFGLISGLSPAFWPAAETWRAPRGLPAFVSLGYDVELRQSAMLAFGVAQRTLPPGTGTVVPVTIDSDLEARDDRSIDWAMKWLQEKRERPSLAVVMLDATHWPYLVAGEPPISVSVESSWQSRELAVPYHARYLRAVAAADARLGRLLDAARAAGHFDDLAIVVAGDHGEAFREHGVFGHGSRLDAEQLRVPLVMKLPGEAPRELTALSTHGDVLPTLLGHLGAAPISPLAAGGIDLLHGEARAVPPLAGSCAISAPDGYAALDGELELLLELDARGARFVRALDPAGYPLPLDGASPRVQQLLDEEHAAYQAAFAPATR